MLWVNIRDIRQEGSTKRGDCFRYSVRHGDFGNDAATMGAPSRDSGQGQARTASAEGRQLPHRNPHLNCTSTTTAHPQSPRSLAADDIASSRPLSLLLLPVTLTHDTLQPTPQHRHRHTTNLLPAAIVALLHLNAPHRALLVDPDFDDD